MLKSLLSILASLLGLAKGRQDLANTPEMQARQQAATDQKLKDTAARDIAARDAEAIRRRLSS